MMNIFILDNDIEKAAQYHCDAHCVKMILETAQLLCTTHYICGTAPDIIPYKKTHENHPSAKWARESIDNYRWLCHLGMALCKEYTHRYGKIHKTEAVISWAIKSEPKILSCGLTPFALAMPDIYKSSDAVISYRDYYKSEKKHLAKWTRRSEPDWFF